MPWRFASVSQVICASGNAAHDRVADLLGRRVERADVVRRPRQPLARRRASCSSASTPSGMAMNGMRVSGRTKQAYGSPLRRRVDHLRRVVRRAARRHRRPPRSVPGSARERKSTLPARALGGELLVVARVVACRAARNTACCTRTSSSGAPTRPRAPCPRRIFVSRSGKPVGGNRRRVHEDDRPAVRLGFVLRELEQVERPFDVDLVRGDRRELRRASTAAPRGGRRARPGTRPGRARARRGRESIR